MQVNVENDTKLKQFLLQYCQTSENLLMQEATTVCPLGGAEEQPGQPGLQAIVTRMNPKVDLDDYLYSYFHHHSKSDIENDETEAQVFF